jgi:hypothetical protein
MTREITLDDIESLAVGAWIRFGAIPKPTVIVRMEENGNDLAHAGRVVL